MNKTYEYLRVFEINRTLVLGARLEDAIALYREKYENDEIESIRLIKDSSIDHTSLALYAVNTL